MRMKQSVYWDRHRKMRQAICIPVVVIKEVFEIVWVIYGMTLDRSKCEEDAGGLNVVLILFIVMGICKMALYTIAGAIFAVIMISRARQNK